MPDFKGKKRTMAYSKSSGFKMKAAAHGGPMRKNFPSAFKQTDPPAENVVYKQDITGEHDTGYETLKKDKANFKKNAERRYNTEITKKDGVWSDPTGKSITDLERDYLAKLQ